MGCGGSGVLSTQEDPSQTGRLPSRPNHVPAIASDIPGNTTYTGAGGSRAIAKEEEDAQEEHRQ